MLASPSVGAAVCLHTVIGQGRTRFQRARRRLRSCARAHHALMHLGELGDFANGNGAPFIAQCEAAHGCQILRVRSQTPVLRATASFLGGAQV